MKIALIVLIGVFASGCGDGGADASSQAHSSTNEPASERSRQVKKDRGDFSVLLDGVEWAATSASARPRDGKLKISASRIDGSPSTTMIRQAIDLDIADFEGPGTYTLGMMSSFTVVGMNTGAPEESGMDQHLADILSKATMVRLQHAEVTISSVNSKEIMGRFSPGGMPNMAGGTVTFSDGRFRAIVKD